MQELLCGVGIVCAYYVVAASSLFACRYFWGIPDELFRKTLHFVLLISYIPFVFAFETWWLSALVALALEVLIYPVLAWFERFKNYSRITTERRKGEFKHSLLLAFTMLAVCMAVCWGWRNDRYLVLASMYAWGVGDAFAALVGKKFGKHKIRMKYADCHKSVEGSAAMFITSALAVWIVLLVRGGLGIWTCLIISLLGAGTATVVELVTKDGLDTVTCPSAAMAVILALTALLGGSV